jgi:hypothetical protein
MLRPDLSEPDTPGRIDARIGVSCQGMTGAALAARQVFSGLALRFGCLRQRPHPRALAGREHGEENAVLGEQLERLAVDRGLRQPHALRLAPEARLKVGDAPANLGHRSRSARQRHDDVVVDLRHRRAVAAKAQPAAPVGLQDVLVGARRVFLQPREQRRPEIES